MIHELAYIIFCLLLAYYNASRIKQDKRIYHGINAAFHIICWTVIYLLTKNWFVISALPFIGRLFFDTSLNLMRGLSISYAPLNPKSWTDIVEEHVFRFNEVLPKVIYLIIIIILNLCICYS